MRFLVALFATVALVACGGGEPTTEPAGTGALHVQVQGIATGAGPTPAQVGSIVVTATDVDRVDHEFELTFDSQSSSWAGTSPRLYTGEYSVTAKAFATNGNEVLFESKPEGVIINHNATVAVILVMHQRTSPTQHPMPYITSVILDRMSVEQDDDIQIRVNAGGGTAPYTLSGRHSITAANPGAFSAGGAMTGATGKLVWTAPFHDGPAWFVVQVTDADGNMAELGITVMVGDDYGWLNASVTFNLAPALNINARALNDGDAATMYFWLDATDTDSTGNIAYAWTSDCNATWSTETSYAAASGTLVSPATDVVFKAAVVGADRDGECVFTLNATDSNGEGASSTMVLTMPTLEAPVDTLRDVVFENAFGADGDFIASATPTGSGIFKWQRNDPSAAQNITAPIAYFLHRAGYFAIAELGFEDMYLRTNAGPTSPANFNSMDLGVLLYAYEVTGETKFKTLAEAMFPAWTTKYASGARAAYFGYDSYSLMLGAYMADKHGLTGADTFLTSSSSSYVTALPGALTANAWHTSWTNLIADEFGIGTRDNTYVLDVTAAGMDVQTVAFAVFSDSVDATAASAYLFDNLASATTSEEAAEGLAALVALTESPLATMSRGVYEDAFGTSLNGEFVATTTATGSGIFKWRRTDVAAATNITAPIAYFLHRAGYTAMAELGFEEMYLRTNAAPTDPTRFNSMDLGVFLYAYEVTGETKFKDLAEDMFAAWTTKYASGPRAAYFGYDSYGLMLGAFMADKHSIVGADTHLATFSASYLADRPGALLADAYHTSWTNLIADEFGVGTRDTTYLLDVTSADADVQSVAFAVLSDSVDREAAAAYLLENLAGSETSEGIAEGLAALAVLGQ